MDIQPRRASSIPLVRSHSLSSREPQQQEWLTAKTFDRTTGNPTRERYSQMLLEETPESIERLHSIQDVQDLRSGSPSYSSYGSESGSTDIEERIRARRKIRHEKVMSEVKEKLALLGSEHRAEIQRLCYELKSNLNEIYTASHKQWIEKTGEEVVVHMSFEDFVTLWKEMEKTFHSAGDRIKRFEKEVTQTERNHSQKVSKVYSEALVSLNEISYLLPDQVDEMLDEQAMSLNLVLLSNRKCYSQLCRELEAGNQRREQKTRCDWESLRRNWKQLKLHYEEKKFKEYIESEDISHPQALTDLKCSFCAEQESIRHSLEKLLEQLSNFSPPQATKAKIYQWKDEFSCLHEQLVSVQSRFLLMWSEAQEKIHDLIQIEMETKQVSFVSGYLLDSSEALQLISDRFLPLVEHHQRSVKEETVKLEKALASLSTLIKSKFTELFQFAQGAAHLWDTHTLKLVDITQENDTNLSIRRADHDLTNQTVEANLDYVLDRLRQAGSKEEVEEYYRQSLHMLDKIKSGYKSFHEDMLGDARKYLPLVRRELENYRRELHQYFGRDKTQSPAKKVKRSSKGDTKQKSSSRLKLTTPSVSPAHKSERAVLIEQVIATSGETSFYIEREPGNETPPNSAAATFLTQDEDVEGRADSFATSALTIDELQYTTAKEGFCLSFVNHLDNWTKDKLREVEKAVKEKEEEFKTELELRLHLHEPRPSRIKEDIHHIRIAELSAHEERVSIHIKGISAKLHKEKNRAVELWNKLDEKVTSFTGSLVKLVSSLSSCTTSTSIKRIGDEAVSLHTKCVESFGAEIEIERSLSLATFEELRLANSSYIKSLKQFPDGGNYSTNEIEKIRPRLAKQTERIKRYKSQTQDELQSIGDSTAERFQLAYTKQFSTEFDYYLTDITLIDSVSKLMTSCQVLIKSEVAASNGQSKEIDELLGTLKEKLTLDLISPLIQSCEHRISYLHCQRTKGETTNPLSSLTHAAAPISAIDVTKSIMSYASGCGPTLDESGKGLTQSTEQLKQRKTSLTKMSKGQTLQRDRKNISFGAAGGGEDGLECFLPKIRAILNDTYKTVYNIAEDYYRQKGSRVGTQPGKLPEVFKEFIDNIIERCRGYYTQAETYRTRCIDELHVQLAELTKVMDKLPLVILGGVAKDNQAKTEAVLLELFEKVTKDMKELDKRKDSHQFSLRPFLGHPERSEELSRLCTQETDRHEETVSTVKERVVNAKKALESASREFLVLLLESVGELLAVYDTCIDVDRDIVPATATIPSQQELMRDYMKGHFRRQKETELKPSSSQLSKTKSIIWPGVTDSTLTFGDTALNKTISMSLTSERDTPGHRSIIEARDATIEDYKIWCTNCLSELEQSQAQELKEEERHYTSWNTSVATIKQLYQN